MCRSFKSQDLQWRDPAIFVDEVGLGGHESVVVPMEKRESVMSDLIDDVEANPRMSIDPSFMGSFAMADSVLTNGIDGGCIPILLSPRLEVEALDFWPFACVEGLDGTSNRNFAKSSPRSLLAKFNVPSESPSSEIGDCDNKHETSGFMVVILELMSNRRQESE